MRRLSLALGAFLILFTQGAVAGDPAPTVWRMATLAPAGAGWSRHIQDLVFPVIEEATNGALKIKVHWGGVLGDDEDYIRKMRAGELEGAGLAGQGATMVCPEMAVLELPFLFENYREVDYVKKTMAPVFDGLVRENGYFLMAWTDQDFDQIYSTHYPMNTLADFRAARFLTWYGPLEEAVLAQLDATAVAVDVPQVPAALDDGLGDTAIAPAMWVVGAQLQTLNKYVNPMKIRYSPALIVVTRSAWKGLPAIYQQEFYERRDGLMSRYCARVRKDNQRALEALEHYGMTLVSMTPEEIAPIRDKAMGMWYARADDLYPRQLLDEVVERLARFRQSGGLDEEPPPNPPASDEAPPLAATWSQRVAQIRSVQKKLSALGYSPGAVDGILGSATFRAILAFEKDRGLPRTGSISLPLLKALGIDPAFPGME